MSLIRERPPLRLALDVVTPGGNKARWAEDDPDPRNAPSSLSFSTVMPGGFEQAAVVLQRDPRFGFTDLEELSTVTARGLGGIVAWQGRLETQPEVSGDQAQITPSLVGWQSHLTDDNSAREIVVDTNLADWVGPTLNRQIQLASNSIVTNGPSIGPAGALGYPALLLALNGDWSQLQYVEAWYDAHGIPLGALTVHWQTLGLTLGFPFDAIVAAAADDVTTAQSSLDVGTGGAGVTTLTITTPATWGHLRLSTGAAASGGSSGAQYTFAATGVGIYGRHGLPLHPTTNPDSPYGVLASDFIAYALGKWAPALKFTTGATGTIQPSAFVIPHMVFVTPGTVSDMLKEATKYELLDWAVWEGLTFYMNARNARGREWRARSGPAQLQQAGPQISRLWNGVIVQFTDTTGKQRSIGPPGSNCDVQDATLLDTDPSNPANQAVVNGQPLRRWATVTMNMTAYWNGKADAALQVGQRFLAEQKLLDTAGQAALVGYVEDDRGILWPAWMVRAGDRIAFIDASDTSYRRIVHTQYDDTTKTNTLQLDQPPDSLQAILERLSISLAPYGMS